VEHFKKAPTLTRNHQSKPEKKLLTDLAYLQKRQLTGGKVL
jgi:hypothetical protein